MPANARMFILERMENQDNNERHDVVKELTERISRLSILCHRPYRTSGKLPWVKIGKEFMSNICTQWQISRSLDIILNTATLPLLRKRHGEGFKDSAFRLNNFVKSCEQWTETELKARQKELQNVFMRLWSMPTTSLSH